jgi:hypothetical protein
MFHLESGLRKAIRCFDLHIEHGGTWESFEDEPWNCHKGCQPYLSDSDLDEVVNELQSDPGKVITHECLTELITKKQHKKATACGIVVLRDKAITPSKEMVQRTQAALALRSTTAVVKTAITKTPTRFTAETSWRCSISLAATVASAHLMPTVSEDYQVREFMKTATPLVKYLLKIVSDYYGRAPVCPVERKKLASMDDSAEYVVEGRNDEATGRSSLMITAVNALNTSGTRLVYNAKSTSTKIGMHIKLTFLMTAAGSTAPAFISVSGLNERKLNPKLCPKGILLLMIKGLYIGGGCLQPDVDLSGYVVLIHNDHDGESDKLKSCIYLDYVLLPFVEQVRRNADGWDPSMDLDESMHFVLWCDGDLAQLAVATDPETVATYRENCIVACKHNAARTAVEQPCDTTNIFKQLHQHQKEMTAADIPPGADEFKDRILKVFHQSRELGLCLHDNKEKALVDYLTCYPTMVSKVVTPTSVQRGFFENGMLSKERPDNKYAYPCFDGLLATCKTEMPNDLYAKCKDIFPTAFEHATVFGEVREELYDKFAFQLTKTRRERSSQTSDSTAATTQACCLSHQQSTAGCQGCSCGPSGSQTRCQAGKGFGQVL